MTAPESPEPSTLDDILRRRKLRAVRNGVILLVLIAAAIALYLLLSPEPPQPLVEPPTRVSPAPRAPVAPSPPPPEPRPAPAPVAPATPPAPPLPALEESDPFVQGLVEALSSRPALAEWLATDELIRRFVAAVDNLAEGKSPRAQLDPLWPEERFRAIRIDGRLTIAPTSYARYDLITDVFTSLDTNGTLEVYRRLVPLIDEAYNDLGYPDQRFDDTLSAAIAELLRTPRVEGEVEVAPRVISYEYTDWELEGLSAAQKQLLRMGPKNAVRVQAKLRELAGGLGIPERELPRAGVYKVKPKLDPDREP